MKAIFAHGKESGPWGSKIKALAELAKALGCEVDSLDYQDLADPDLRVQRLLDYLSTEQDDYILVGSSMGGYVSLVAGQEVAGQKAADSGQLKGIFLLAPALYLPGYRVQNFQVQSSQEHGFQIKNQQSRCPVAIVHGWSDEVIPPDNAIRFAREAQCSLHLIKGDHRLNSSLPEVLAIFSSFIGSVLA